MIKITHRKYVSASNFVCKLNFKVIKTCELLIDYTYMCYFRYTGFVVLLGKGLPPSNLCETRQRTASPGSYFHVYKGESLKLL